MAFYGSEAPFRITSDYLHVQSCCRSGGLFYMIEGTWTIERCLLKSSTWCKGSAPGVGFTTREKNKAGLAFRE